MRRSVRSHTWSKFNGRRFLADNSSDEGIHIVPTNGQFRPTIK